VEKLFFNKRLIRDLLAWSLNLAIAFGKGLLLFWASRSCSGTAYYNSEPSKQTYESEMEPLLAQGLGKLWKSCSLIRV